MKDDIGNIVKQIEQLWFDRKTPSSDNLYIDIYEGWSDKDETNKSRYWMFSARIPNSRALIYTGVDGFLNFWEITGYIFPIRYNGIIVPVDEYNKFLEYCRDDEEE
jgi:hypothetical protein